MCVWVCGERERERERERKRKRKRERERERRESEREEGGREGGRETERDRERDGQRTRETESQRNETDRGRVTPPVCIFHRSSLVMLDGTCILLVYKPEGFADAAAGETVFVGAPFFFCRWLSYFWSCFIKFGFGCDSLRPLLICIEGGKIKEENKCRKLCASASARVCAGVLLAHA